MYQAYEACLKNWYQEEYDPALENQFRLDLMEELLFDNGWTFLDVEQRLNQPWIRIDRNEEGWMNPSRSLPYPADEHLLPYRSINGAEVSYTTGVIHFYLTPWDQSKPVYEKVIYLI